MYMAIARIAAERCHDPKHRVGCAIVANDQITIGWAGTPEGMTNEMREPVLVNSPHGLRLHMKTKSTVMHAEWNALSKFTFNSASAAGGTLYTTMGCCPVCAPLVYRARLKRVVYYDEYKDPSGMQFLRDRGIEVVKL